MPHFSTKVRHFPRRRGVRVIHPTPGDDADPARGELVPSFFSPLTDAIPGEHAPILSPEPEIDVCKSLFALCQRCQADYLDGQDIDLLFDVHGGDMPAATYHKVELLIESLMADIAHGPARRTGGTVTLTVRRQANMWIIGIAEEGGGASERCGERRSTLARGLSQNLGGTWRVETRPPNGCITGFMFPAPSSGQVVEVLKH